MSDIYDQASDREQLERELSIKKHRQAASLLPTGSCYYCDTILTPDRLFCDADCRDDYQAEQDANRRN